MATTAPLEDHVPSPTRPLAGKVAVVTGGGRGLGSHLAQAFAAAGAAVGLVGRGTVALEEVETTIRRSGGTVAAVTADVSDTTAAGRAVSELAGRLGAVDVLVNNAGVNGPVGPLWEVDPDAWWHAMEVNLRGVFTCNRQVLPGMVARGRGCIVNITSEAGVFRWPLVSGYAVSKAAVVKLTEGLAAELKGTGVSAFSVHPGLLPIGLSEPALASDAPEGSPEGKVFGWVRRQLDEGHGVEPQRAARLLVRLASGEADQLSGRHLSVHDDLDTLLRAAGSIREEDLYTLRLRQLPACPVL